jgi:hypothetical protein
MIMKKRRLQKVLLLQILVMQKNWVVLIGIIKEQKYSLFNLGTYQNIGVQVVESLGFIIGEYTVPAKLPIIYITDSNNARTLQRRIKNCDGIMHQIKVRKVKQGIEYSIANHLELLTSKWPRLDQLISTDVKRTS